MEVHHLPDASTVISASMLVIDQPDAEVSDSIQVEGAHDASMETSSSFVRIKTYNTM